LGVAQLNLFDELAPRQNSARLMQVLDQLNAKNGRGARFPDGVQAVCRRGDNIPGILRRRQQLQ
jgi:hypothetical protein